MGSNFSEPQTLTISDNGKWIQLKETNAYINISTIAYFYIKDEHYIVMKLLDNGTNGDTLDYIDFITSKRMNEKKIQKFVKLMTK